MTEDMVKRKEGLPRIPHIDSLDSEGALYDLQRPHQRPGSVCAPCHEILTVNEGIEKIRNLVEEERE